LGKRVPPITIVDREGGVAIHGTPHPWREGLMGGLWEIEPKREVTPGRWFKRNTLSVPTGAGPSQTTESVDAKPR